jgi:cell division protein FtsQ
MSAAHVRRGGAARAKAKKPSKVAVPRKIAKRLPVDQARANKLAALVFGAFVVAIAAVTLIALDIPAKAERAAGAAVGQAGFKVSGYQIVGLNHMIRALVVAVFADELRRAAAVA